MYQNGVFSSPHTINNTVVSPLAPFLETAYPVRDRLMRFRSLRNVRTSLFKLFKYQQLPSLVSVVSIFAFISVSMGQTVRITTRIAPLHSSYRTVQSLPERSLLNVNYRFLESFTYQRRASLGPDAVSYTVLSRLALHLELPPP